VKKPFAITLDPGSSLANHTGSWRTVRPVYVDRLPPCNDACPSGENIQGWLFHAESGDYERAWRLLTEANPLPACMGRVCYHPCETACNRAQLDECVGVNAIERFIGDEALKHGWKFRSAAKSTGMRVLVVGAGPSGLSAAYQLARSGHTVTIREAGPLAGGMMRFGIPKYRLPRTVLDAEIARIVALGVTIELNSKVDDVLAAKREGRFDAVFLAVGAHLAKRAYLPAGSAGKMLDAVAVLRSMEGEDRPLLGRRVVVYGGGNTALDVARTAKRLGAEESVIVYRRTREKMPAHDAELEEALQEGVLVKWLSTIREAGESSITVEKMTLDEKGMAQPTGEFETLEADSVVLALGQDVDLSLLDGVPGLEIDGGVVKVGANMMTGHAGIFAGGDMVQGERTVTVGIGHGKLAARNIDAWLRGETWTHPPRHELASFDKLNTWYYSDAPKAQRRPADRAPATRHRAAHQQLRRSAGRPDRRQRPVRGAALPELRQLLRVRQLLRSVPRQRGDQARRRQPLRVQLRLLQGLRTVRVGVPVRRDPDAAGGDLGRPGRIGSAAIQAFFLPESPGLA
jgi:NADPH-dependent glutamate synthase beta subunit-like oxidoreductase